MIERGNAQLLSLFAPPAPDGDGGYHEPIETALTGVRCFVADTVKMQQIAAAGRLEKLSDVVYVLARHLAGQPAPVQGGGAVWRMDGADEMTRREILEVHLRAKDGGLTHYEIWCAKR